MYESGCVGGMTLGQASGCSWATKVLPQRLTAPSSNTNAVHPLPPTLPTLPGVSLSARRRLGVLLANIQASKQGCVCPCLGPRHRLRASLTPRTHCSAGDTEVLNSVQNALHNWVLNATSPIHTAQTLVTEQETPGASFICQGSGESVVSSFHT